MDISKGYLRLFRKFTEWEWYNKPATKIIFLHCLLCANHKEKTWQGIKIKRGQFITSLETLAIANGLTVRQTRTALNDLQMTNEIDRQTTSRYSIITVKNWDLYQPTDKVKNTPKRQANDKQNGTQTTTTNNTNSNTSYINISLSHKEEKITKEEREILTNYVKKNNLASKSVRAYVNAMIKNGDHIEILEQEKTKKTKTLKTNIKSDLKKIRNLYQACYFVGKYGDYTDENHPQEVLEVMEKYNIENFTAATRYVNEYKEEEK